MTPLKTAFFAIGLALAPAAIAQQPTAAPVAATPAAPAATAPTPGIGMPTPGAITLQPQVTPNGEDALFMHDAILMPIIVAISLFVLFLLFWASFRYRRSANPIPSKTSHNTFIEVVWTLVPVLILVGIAIPSISLLAAQYKPPGKDALTIKAIGNQWYWSYEYPDNGGFELTANMLKDDEAKARGEPRLLATDNRVFVPVGRVIRLLTTSNDVIHSWAVPAFWTKMDAVPGRINETSFLVEKPGVYYGQCSELCGARHAFMPIAVEAVSEAQFNQWVLSKGGTVSGKGTPTSAPAAIPASSGVTIQPPTTTPAAPAPVAATKS